MTILKKAKKIVKKKKKVKKKVVVKTATQKSIEKKYKLLLSSDNVSTSWFTGDRIFKNEDGEDVIYTKNVRRTLADKEQCYYFWLKRTTLGNVDEYLKLLIPYRYAKLDNSNAKLKIIVVTKGWLDQYDLKRENWSII